VRDTSKDAIQEINDMGVEVVMLTGDNEVVAETIGKEMDIMTVKSNLKPADKCDEIKRFSKAVRLSG
jgi:Cu+-exporting ATPase